MDVIERARELCVAIQSDETYIKMAAAKEKNDKNLELQEKISNFNLKKIALNREVTKTEKDSTKIAQYDREMREAYSQIMQDPDMIEYSEAKAGLDALMKKIETLLAMTLSGADPKTAVIPESSGCSGNCSDCAGCH